MNVCKRFPKGSVCIICGKNTPGESVLIPIIDKVEDCNAECSLVHLSCLDLWYYPDQKLIAQKIY